MLNSTHWSLVTLCTAVTDTVWVARLSKPLFTKPNTKAPIMTRCHGQCLICPHSLLLLTRRNYQHCKLLGVRTEILPDFLISDNWYTLAFHSVVHLMECTDLCRKENEGQSKRMTVALDYKLGNTVRSSRQKDYEKRTGLPFPTRIQLRHSAPPYRLYTLTDQKKWMWERFMTKHLIVMRADSYLTLCSLMQTPMKSFNSLNCNSNLTVKTFYRSNHSCKAAALKVTTTVSRLAHVGE